MKKVAIMTWYTHRNYGTALQACATNYLLQRMGYAPSFIQYLPQRGAYQYNHAYFYKRCVAKIKGMLKPVYCSELHEAKYTEFFSKRINQTNQCNSYAELHDLNDQFDAFLCGSDQIWTPLNHDDKYFLSFVDNTDKMIAYAPSIGVSEISDPLIRARMKKLIGRFKHLSVREQQGAELIRQMTGRIPQVVLDPTLLLNASEWNEVADTQLSQKIAEKKYIICYFLGDANKYMRYVQELSRKLNMPYYLIPVTQQQKKSKHAVPFEVGPCEFVSLIKEAQYVCTDSFHGIAFAANYNIPFSVFKRFSDHDSGSQNSRIYNLLEILHLQNRLCNYKHPYIPVDIIECNFSTSNAFLEKQREESLLYLERMLKMAVHAETLKQTRMVITDTCCGCGACATVCSHHAISINKNSQGFEHYEIDASKCVNCGQCRTVCPMTNITASHMQEAKALYAVKSNSVHVLRKSASGGIGHELATMYLNRGYAICGCAYDTNSNTASHIWVLPGEEEKLQLLQGSKYIQSISADALLKAVTICKEHQIVFFGTPCQVAAMDKLLNYKKMREQALLVDLICHGVPSYYLWNNYLNFVDSKYNVGKHPNVIFRKETRKWQKRIMQINGNGNTYEKHERKDEFYAFFRRGLCDMQSCFECPYRKKSAADLRIGDYWGNRFAKNEYGTSMVISNTTQGEIAIQDLLEKGNCSIEKHGLDEYWSIQNTTNPAKILIREGVLSELKDTSQDIRRLRKKYCVYYDIEDGIFRMIAKIKSYL